MTSNRREFLTHLCSAALTVGAAAWSRGVVAADDAAAGNFRFVYGNREYREAFRDFLVNVFHLYPEDELHGRIASLSEELAADRDIYLALQDELGQIKPFLGDLRFALPTLMRQKAIMARQTAALLDDGRSYDGYLEIGSTGRYLDRLEEIVDIGDARYFVAPVAPGYSVMDLVDRGQIAKAGRFLPLDDYQPQLGTVIAPQSLDLVTVYIGFHHCPLNLREAFFASIREAMKPGSVMVVRDHDAKNEKMRRVVALAHDVFNMGTRESWQYNRDELRNFYSLAELDAMLTRAGFRGDGRRLYQDGDPTLNALMVYRKA